MGVGVSKENSYPNQLALLSGLTVVNAGVSGEVTEDGLPHFEKMLRSEQPDLIILLEGGNDILRNMPFNRIKSNLQKMIRLAADRQIPLILIGVPKKSLFSSAASFYAELAGEHQLIFDDETISSLLKKSSMKSDQVHFNEKGYQYLANEIYQLIVENGGLSDRG